MPDRLTVWAVPGLPEVRAGDDLAALVLAAIATSGPEASGLGLLAGDVLVVSSKVVSKALGLVEPAGDADAVAAVVRRQSRRVVAQRRTPRGLSRVVQSAAGPVMAAAGVDTSNTPAGLALTLPVDPDHAARELRARLRELGAPDVAVVLSDTAGRAWRRGQSDLALGVAGLQPLDDLRGSVDAGGRLLEVTERAVADELAAAADLVKGKAGGTPVAVVRGLGVGVGGVGGADGPGAAVLLRDATADWFRLGHVEAVRAALGVPADVDPDIDPEAGVEAPSVLPEPVTHRVRRAIDVALHGGPAVQVRLDDGLLRLAGAAFDRGVVAQRLLCALWAEDVPGRLADGGVRLGPTTEAT